MHWWASRGPCGMHSMETSHAWIVIHPIIVSLNENKPMT